MNFKEKYPDFAAIEGHIRAARLERAVYLSQVLVDTVEATIAGLKRLGSYVSGNVDAGRARRTVQADVFLKRSVPRY